MAEKFHLLSIYQKAPVRIRMRPHPTKRDWEGKTLMVSSYAFCEPTQHHGVWIASLFYAAGPHQ
jgi:hypothetical protein